MIYEPKGAAREYSPLALNYYKGCDHGCKYCYVPSMMTRFNKNYNHADMPVPERFQLIQKIKKSAEKHKHSKKQVFLSFTSDPYNSLNNELKITVKVLRILLENDIPVSILSKGGLNIMQDIDVISQFRGKIQVGATLTLIKPADLAYWEKGAPDYQNRIESLKRLKAQGTRTWVSLEPVIDPAQTLRIIQETSDFVDYYKVGKLNHDPSIEKTIDWQAFLTDVVNELRMLDKPFYIKNDLAKHKHPALQFKRVERDADYFALSR
jgi:DNA repair photolyase